MPTAIERSQLDQALPASDDTERLERAARALSTLELEVLVLSAGHQMRIPAIAALLGIGEPRAERLLARALRKFDKALHPRERRWWRLW
jgi:DNA-directed RNA polymerase specialized sigma24 family protein